MAGKDSGCGKCGANACGESCRDRMRLQQQRKHHTAKRKRLRNNKSNMKNSSNKK